MSADIVNQRLDKVLEILRQQTDIEFYVDDDVIDQSICADFRNLSIAFGIKKMLEGTGINHAVIANRKGPEAIFIGNSQKPQASYRKLDTRPTIPGRRQTSYQAPQLRQPSNPAKNIPHERKKTQPLSHIKSAITIPTAGGLTTPPPVQSLSPKSVPGTQRKDKEE